MKNLNKTNLNKLRIEHNRVVKNEYKCRTQKMFNDYFYQDLNMDDSENMYVEISKHETKSGNPYILEVA